MIKLKLFRMNAITIALAVLESLLILIIPLVGLEGTTAQKVFSFIIAALFWGSIVAEIIMVVLTSKERRYMEKQKYRSRVLGRSRPGALNFFKNRESVIADVILIISIVAIVVLVWKNINNPPWLITGSVAALLLSINLHCIFNGKNYRYLKAYLQYKKEHE